MVSDSGQQWVLGHTLHGGSGRPRMQPRPKRELGTEPYRVGWQPSRGPCGSLGMVCVGALVLLLRRAPTWTRSLWAEPRDASIRSWRVENSCRSP